jgi:methyl-accepting chemotaxis protein
MLKGFSLSAKLYFGFGTVLAISAMLGIFAYTRIVQISHSADTISKDCMPGILTITKVRGLGKDIYAHATASLLAKDKAGVEAERGKIKAAAAKVDELLETYQGTITQAKDRELFAEVAPALAAYRATQAKLLDLAAEGKRQEAEAFMAADLKAALDKYQGVINKVVEFNETFGNENAGIIVRDVAAAKGGIIVGLLLAVSLGAAIGIFLSRSIANALNFVITGLASGSEQVASASHQVSQSSQSMAEGASEQASSLEETSASLEEMSSMTKQNSDNARQASGMAAETRSAVEKSREAMTRMGDAISRIKGSSDQTAKIIKTIDEIAFQTNLLALNAAVEAARAGDAGKGFAVVAEEVRNLAQRSAEAAKSTASLIEESQQNANDGVSVSGEVAGILTGIVESVQKLTQLIGEVSAASDEQSKGIEQIGTAVTEMDKLTQANAANAEESASASEELAAQAKELGEMVQVLVGIVKGASGAPGSAATVSAGSAYASPRPAARRASASSGKSALAASRGLAHGGKADKASAKAAGADWSAAVKTHANGHGHAHATRSARPEQVIPMDDSELKDF